MFMSGVYLIPIALVEEVEAKLVSFAAKREQLVDAFVEAYPAQVQDAKQRLRSAFSANDYRASERVKMLFGMEWRYVAFSVPGRTHTVSRELFKSEHEKAARQRQEALEEVRARLRTHLSEHVNHLVERLTSPGPDSKPKTFKNTLVTTCLPSLKRSPCGT